jgi:hypothetical protein
MSHAHTRNMVRGTWNLSKVTELTLKLYFLKTEFILLLDKLLSQLKQLNSSQHKSLEIRCLWYVVQKGTLSAERLSRFYKSTF